MDPFGSGGNPSPARRSGLQGPRPTPIKVNKESHKIAKKPPPHPHHHRQEMNPEPVIIYAVSPKVILTTASDFKNLVQRLTANSSCHAAAAMSGDVSPAARLASIERVSPSHSQRERERERERATASGDDQDQEVVSRILEGTNVEFRKNIIPSILSPAPATLPPITLSGLFSPTMIDPFMQVSNMFIPSPSSTWFSAPMATPSPSSYDLFTPFFDF